MADNAEGTAVPTTGPVDFTTREHRPGKVIALHLNYPSRIAQRGRSPQFPGYFLKAGTSIATTGAEIERPAGTELLAYEGEIALVIGKTTRRVSPEEGWASVSHVTASNDCGVYDLRYADKGSNVRSKGGDGFTPLGPAVIPADSVDPNASSEMTASTRPSTIMSCTSTPRCARPHGSYSKS